MEHLITVREDIRKLTSLIKAYLLRPGPGRPRHPKVTLASKMRSQGKSWAKVFTLCLPDRTLYDSSEAYRTAKQRLKKAVRQRQKRAEAARLADYPDTPPTNSAKFV